MRDLRHGPQSKDNDGVSAIRIWPKRLKLTGYVKVDASTATTDWVSRLSGDEPARSQAIEELNQILVRGLSRTLRDRYEPRVQVEDVAQMAVLKIMDSLDSFEGRSRFITWAMTIATRIGISELRRKHYQDVSLSAVTPDEGLKFDPSIDDSAGVENRLDRTEILNKLKELIETELTDKQRLAVRASLDGLPVEEIARRTDSNRNAIYKLIHDARMNLRNGFEAAGFAADDFSILFN